MSRDGPSEADCHTSDGLLQSRGPMSGYRVEKGHLTKHMTFVHLYILVCRESAPTPDREKRNHIMKWLLCSKESISQIDTLQNSILVCQVSVAFYCLFVLSGHFFCHFFPLFLCRFGFLL